MGSRDREPMFVSRRSMTADGNVVSYCVKNASTIATPVVPFLPFTNAV